MSSIRTVHDGIRIYTRPLLAIYDFVVMRVLTPYVWRCPAKHYAALYQAHMSPNHADIGVGTAYILKQLRYEPGEVRIGLFDLQPNCLKAAANRLAPYRPETYLCDVMRPIALTAPRFDSAALGGVLHCLPGDMAEKGRAFDSAVSLLSRDGRLFGYTILNREVHKTRLSRAVYFVLQKLRVINGLGDSASQLRVELKKRFRTSEVKVVGCVALFWAFSPLRQ